jgi:hypothetical protein
MPLFFASNAIYPLDLMPAWLRAVSRLNPLTPWWIPFGGTWSRAVGVNSVSAWASSFWLPFSWA